MKAAKRILLIVLCGFLSNSVLADDQSSTVSYTVEIESPQDQQTFPSATQSIPVTLSITPTLQANDLVTLYVDGQASGDPVNSTSITLPALERGSHTLQAKVTHSSGEDAGESDTITIYQQRVSKLLPPADIPIDPLNQPSPDSAQPVSLNTTPHQPG